MRLQFGGLSDCIDGHLPQTGRVSKRHIPLIGRDVDLRDAVRSRCETDVGSGSCRRNLQSIGGDHSFRALRHGPGDVQQHVAPIRNERRDHHIADTMELDVSLIRVSIE